MPWPLQSVVELAPYRAWAEGVLTHAEQDALVDLLADDPKTGVVLRGTGGVRKVRFATNGRGKRGSVRIIYYFHSADVPLYILGGFAKNEKDDLTDAERNGLRKVVDWLVDFHSR